MASAFSNKADKSHFQYALVKRLKFLKDIHHAEIWKIVVSRSMDGGGLEPVKLAHEPASSCPKLCVSFLNAPIILPVPPFL